MKSLIFAVLVLMIISSSANGFSDEYLRGVKDGFIWGVMLTESKLTDSPEYEMKLMLFEEFLDDIAFFDEKDIADKLLALVESI
jgi:hypothetical protein